jgi:hypothetical protein
VPAACGCGSRSSFSGPDTSMSRRQCPSVILLLPPRPRPPIPIDSDLRAQGSPCESVFGPIGISPSAQTWAGGANRVIARERATDRVPCSHHGDRAGATEPIIKGVGFDPNDPDLPLPCTMCVP